VSSSDDILCNVSDLFVSNEQAIFDDIFINLVDIYSGGNKNMNIRINL